MKAHRRIAPALLPCSLLAEDLAPLPPAAEMTVKNYQPDLGTIRDRAVKDLTTILNAETRRGNTKEAASVQNAIDTITEGQTGAAGGAADGLPKSSNSFLGNVPDWKIAQFLDYIPFLDFYSLARSSNWCRLQAWMKVSPRSVL